VKKLCPNCDELLKPTENPEVGRCAGCGWTGHYWRAAKEPALLETPPKMPYGSIDLETTGLDPATCQTLEVGAVIDDWKTPIDQRPRFRRVRIYDNVSGNPYPMALNASLLKSIANAPKATPQPPHHPVATWAEKCAIDRPLDSAVVTLAINNQPINWWNVPNKLLAGGFHPAIRDGLIDLAANPPGTSCFCKPDELARLFCDWLVAYSLDPASVQAAGKNFASFDMQFLYRLPGFAGLVKFRHRVLDPAILYWRPLQDERLPDSKTCYERAGIDGKVAHTAVEDALAVVQLVRMGIKRLLV